MERSRLSTDCELSHQKSQTRLYVWIRGPPWCNKKIASEEKNHEEIEQEYEVRPFLQIYKTGGGPRTPHLSKADYGY